MGYETHFTGAVTIRPPLSAAELRTLGPFVVPAGQRWCNRDVRIEIAESHRETDEGVLLIREGTAIVPVVEDPYKGYDIELHVRELVDILTAAGHEANGTIRARGEEGEVWRMVVANGEVRREDAKLVWPDGAEETR